MFAELPEVLQRLRLFGVCLWLLPQRLYLHLQPLSPELHFMQPVHSLDLLVLQRGLPVGLWFLPIGKLFTVQLPVLFKQQHLPALLPVLLLGWFSLCIWGQCVLLERGQGSPPQQLHQLMFCLLLRQRQHQ